MTMTIFRRFLVVQLLMLWQGGFVFYAAIVVPAGTRELGGAFEQSRVTRVVTPALNLIGAAAVLVFAWELLQAPPRAPCRRRVLWSCWAVMVAGLVALFALHPRIADFLNYESSKITNPADFRFVHGAYLSVSTVQWFAGLVFAAGIITNWRESDRTTKGSP